MPGELNKVSLTKAIVKERRTVFGKVSSKKTKWTQKRAQTTIILLKIRVNHGILILIEVHPLEKNCLIRRRMELRNQETKAIAKEKRK